MSDPMRTLTIQPEGAPIPTMPGATALDALTQAGVAVTTPCGRAGQCGKCRVVIRAGVSAPTETEKATLSTDDLINGVRLACQTLILDDTEVIVPPASRAPEMRVLIGGVARSVPFDPAVALRSARWTGQTLKDALPLFDRLRRLLDARADLSADLSMLRQLPSILNGENMDITGVICGARLIAVEQGDTSAHGYGMAFDVGTTTVVGTLVDITRGEDSGSASAINRQTRYGHDVIARIYMTLEQNDGTILLQRAVVETINSVIEKLLSEQNISPDSVYEMTVAGNATMTHLLLGIPPRPLGFLPYVPVMSHGFNVDAGTLGIHIHPSANIHVLPGIAGFVGADTVAAILAAGMDEDHGDVRMLADVGTNCEIVLRHGSRLIACSTPAGPAFEGARIRNGMYAGPGAIERVRLDEDCALRVIGRIPPQGICGSGLVDLGAELLRVGIMDETGRLLDDPELDGRISFSLRRRLVETDGERSFVVAETEEGNPLVLTQRDIRELQVAKAAIRSGVEVLLDAAGLCPEDVSTLYLAGGFGSYLNRAHALYLGMIPDMPVDRIRFTGNAAAVGARLALVSQEMRRRAEQVARHAEHLQIADTPDFQFRFAEAMLFTQNATPGAVGG